MLAAEFSHIRKSVQIVFALKALCDHLEQLQLDTLNRQKRPLLKL